MAFAAITILDVFLLCIKTCYSYAFDVSCNNLSLYNVCEYVYKKFVCIIVLSSRDRDTVVFINSMIKKKKSRWNQPLVFRFKCHDLSNYFNIKSRTLEILNILLFEHYRYHFVSIVFISVLFLIRSWKHQVVGTKIWETLRDLILTFLSREV